MLAIQPTTSSPSKDQCTPNLLPCRIHHNGPANASRRYWNPTVGADGHPEAYFRGRKLKGKKLSVPEGYRGAVVMMEEKKQGADLEKGKLRIEGDEEEEGEGVQTVGTLEEVGEFEEVIVWDHEAIRSGEDAFVKGMEEWIRFAEVINDSGEAEINEGEGGGGKGARRFDGLETLSFQNGMSDNL